MNTDIRISVDFWSHPKTGRLIRAVGLEGVRSLQILWMWVARNRPSGDLHGMDDGDIEFAADWRGNPGDFFAAIKTQWLDIDNDEYYVHDWQEHNSWAAESEERSDSGRLSRLCRKNPEIGKALKSQGVTGISKEEYAHYSKSTTVQPTYNENEATVQPTYNESCAFPSTPVPVPVPVLKDKRILCENESTTPPLVPAPHGAESAKKMAKNFCTEQFEVFWEAFGDKRGKERSWNAWRKIKKLDRALMEIIIAGARRYAAQRQAIVDRKGIPKMAEGWLNDRRWEDEDGFVAVTDAANPELDAVFARVMEVMGDG